ncbi:MAG: hypothetical protein LUH22_12850 [Bacteroides sp.]|nr:hypothetical protein [Bacteroides sp.]
MKPIFNLKTFLYILFSITSIWNGVAQNMHESQKALQHSVVPESPHSMTFTQYLNHEISEYNGLTQIEIPLYEIEIKGLKIPISLSYHSSGIRYKQYNGEVGVGWSLRAGGYRISRTVNNKPDEYTDFYDSRALDQLQVRP